MDIYSTPKVKAEHRKFYYKCDPVILTSKAGCVMLDEAYELLNTKFVGLPIAPKYQAVGDGKRPQHRTVVFGEEKIMLTGKRSSGLVGQVFEMLNEHFNSVDRPTRQTRDVLPGGGQASLNPNSETVWKRAEEKSNSVPQKSGAIIECNLEANAHKSQIAERTPLIPFTPTCVRDNLHVNSDQIQIIDITGDLDSESQSTRLISNRSQAEGVEGDEWYSTLTSSRRIPSTYSKQKKLVGGLVNKALFSKAITDLRRNNQSRTQISPRAQSGEEKICPDCESEPELGNTSKESDLISADPSIISVISEAGRAASPVNAEETPTDTTNGDTKCNSIDESGMANEVSNDSVMRIPVSTSPKTLAEVYKHFTNISFHPRPVQPPQEPVSLVKEDLKTPPTADVVPCGDNSVSDFPHKGNRKVFSREELLSLSQCESCCIYPQHQVADENSEILIRVLNAHRLFDPSNHRLPNSELVTPPPYPSQMNGSRRQFSEPNTRRPASQSDPRSWGDASGNKRGRKLSTGPAELLYSESAYNCLETVPESATFCTELDQVFKNDANVVPGVAFTKRPRESLDAEYVQEMLDSYNSQRN